MLVLSATEQELHVLWSELLHGGLVGVDRRVDHVSFLFLEHDDSRFNRVFDTQTSDNARALLSDTMTTIGRLPLGGRVPPSATRSAMHKDTTMRSVLTGRR